MLFSDQVMGSLSDSEDFLVTDQPFLLVANSVWVLTPN